MIDATDLRPMKAHELKIGGVFYMKNDKGEFLTCQIFQEELQNENRAAQLRVMTIKLSEEGKLFVRINRPFKSFV